MNVSRLCHLTLRQSRAPFFLVLQPKFYLNSCSLPCVPHHVRQISTVETKNLQKDESLVTRFLSKVPFLNFNKTKVMASAYFLYETIADRVSYIDFFQELDLPDTFYSWFVITELHIWMLSARAMAEGDDGRLLRNYLVEALWNDVGQRIKQLGGESNPTSAREQVSELSEQLQAALIAYDEGLQGDDTVLAGAVWRRFYQQRDVDPLHLEALVKYIRKQMRVLDHLPKETIFEKKKVEWIPLK